MVPYWGQVLCSAPENSEGMDAFQAFETSDSGGSFKSNSSLIPTVEIAALSAVKKGVLLVPGYAMLMRLPIARLPLFG